MDWQDQPVGTEAPQSKRLGCGMQQGPLSRKHAIQSSSDLGTGWGSRSTPSPRFQTIVSTPKQAKSNAFTDHYLRQIWINLGEAAPCFDLQWEGNGHRIGTWFRFGILTILCVPQPSIYLHHWSVNSMNKFYYLGAL